jgi:hypothetical protein
LVFRVELGEFLDGESMDRFYLLMRIWFQASGTCANVNYVHDLDYHDLDLDYQIYRGAV